jgi:hypothetical protein
LKYGITRLACDWDAPGSDLDRGKDILLIPAGLVKELPSPLSVTPAGPLPCSWSSPLGLILGQMNLVHTLAHDFIKFHFSMIRLLLGLSSGVLPSGLLMENSRIFPACFKFLSFFSSDITVVIIFYEEYEM